LGGVFGSATNPRQLSRIDGGPGIDTLALSGSGVTFDLTSVSNQGSSAPGIFSRLNSIEWINITGSGNNILKLAVKDIRDLTQANLINSSNQASLLWTGTAFPASTQRQQLVITGDSGDSLIVVDGSSYGGFTKGGQATYNSLDTYDVWNSGIGLVQLIVRQNVTFTVL
jgi:hypothetical protein